MPFCTSQVALLEDGASIYQFPILIFESVTIEVLPILFGSIWIQDLLYDPNGPDTKWFIAIQLGEIKEQ